jgi:hypothetical protein
LQWNGIFLELLKFLCIIPYVVATANIMMVLPLVDSENSGSGASLTTMICDSKEKA